jgi:hypothetical protein
LFPAAPSGSPINGPGNAGWNENSALHNKVKDYVAARKIQENPWDSGKFLVTMPF